MIESLSRSTRVVVLPLLLDSTNLEIFLENLEENVILIAVTFDEASTKYVQQRVSSWGS